MKTHYPLLRPFALYAIGLYIAYTIPASFVLKTISAGWILLVILLLFSFFSHFFWKYRFRYLFGFCMMLCFFVIGYMQIGICREKEQQTEKEWVSVPADAVYIAKIIELPKVGEKSVKAAAKLFVGKEGKYSENTFSPVRGKCLLRFKKTVASEQLAYGDCLLVSAPVQDVGPPKNEGEFDYRRYLLRKDIYRQISLRDDDWILYGKSGGNPVILLSMRWHAKIVGMIRDGTLRDVTKGIAATMLMGDEVMLNEEQSQTFQAAGVSHVLCVSGMHVGIIYIILNYLFFFLNGSQWRKIVKQVLLLAVIWLYACMVGLTPSVVRSAVMFTFIAVGGMFRRETRTYNSLLTAAFCMLLFNPMLLFEVGFQLSFLAVWGILWVQPMLQKMWEPAFPPLAYLWSIWSVSIAAQLFTFPISVCYFHQFPTYFLLSNIVVMVLAPFVIGVSLFFLSVSAIPWLAVISAKLLNCVVFLMNGGVRLVTCLPHAVCSGLSLNNVQVFMLYLLIIFCLLWCEKRSFQRTIALLFAVFCFSVCQNIICDKRVKERLLNVYAVPNAFVAQFVENGSSVLFTNDSSAYCQGKFDYQLKNLLCRKPYSSPICVSSQKRTGSWVWSPPYFQCGGVDFYYLKEYLVKDTLSHWSPDYLLVGNQTKTSLAKALECLHPRAVCVLSGTFPGRVARWREDCIAADIPCLLLDESGMLQLSLPGHAAFK